MLLITVVGSSCRSEALPASPEQVSVVMDEYSFSYDRSIPDGRVVFRARNAGRLDHELVLVSIPEEFPLTIDAQLRSSTRAAFPTRAYLPPRPPGVDGTFAVDLQPGRYALICFVTDPDGENHARKGMSGELTAK